MSRKESVSSSCKETRLVEYTGNVNNHINVMPSSCYINRGVAHFLRIMWSSCKNKNNHGIGGSYMSHNHIEICPLETDRIH